MTAYIQSVTVTVAFVDATKDLSTAISAFAGSRGGLSSRPYIEEIRTNVRSMIDPLGKRGSGELDIVFSSTDDAERFRKELKAAVNSIEEIGGA